MRLFTLAMPIALCLSLIGASAAAADCRSVYAIGSERQIVDCPADESFDFCIVRPSLVDRTGLLTGRLEFYEDSSKGFEHPGAPTLNVYSAVDRIRTDHGDLESVEHGIFDAESQNFTGLIRVTGGTGELADYTGTLTGSGHSKGTVLITGTIWTPPSTVSEGG